MQDSNPLDRAIHENYSALARKHGVKLHFKRRPTSQDLLPDHFERPASS